MPVVIVTSGGMPVTEKAGGMPVSVVSAGQGGLPVRVVASGGLPVVGSGGGDTPPTGFALTDIASGRLFQRTKDLTTGPVSATGTYSGGTPNAIELQVRKVSDNTVVKAWTTASATIIGNNWSASITGVAQGGSYYVEARPSNATGLAATGSNPFYVGILIVMYGQSNMLYMSTTTSSPPSATAGTRYFDGSAWGNVPAGNGVRELLNGVIAATGVPCAALNGAISGVPIAGLVKGQTNYTNLAAQIAAAGGDFEFIAWHQGEGDSAGGTSQATYLAALDQLHADLATDFGRTKAQAPLVVAGLSTNTSGVGFGTDASWDAMQRTLLEAGNTLTACTYSHSNLDAVLADGSHWTAASYGRAGKRYARTIGTLLGATSGYPKWTIASAEVISATVTRVVMTHGLGTDFTPTSAITGFDVSGDNGGSWVSCTGARVNATTLDLTHASVATTSSRKLRYQYGLSCNVSAPVVDNSSLAAPLLMTAGNLSPAPLAVLPVWTPRFGGNLSGSGGTQTLTAVAIGDAAPRRLIGLAIAASNDNGGFVVEQITITPNVGSPVVVSAPIVRLSAVQIWQALLGSDADAATTVDVEVYFGVTGYAGGTALNLWTIPSGDLSSVTPVDFQSAQAASATATSITNLTTSAGGCIIAFAATPSPYEPTRTGIISGSESMTERYDAMNSGIPHVSADASAVSAHAANCTVTATITLAGDLLTLVAASWR